MRMMMCSKILDEVRRIDRSREEYICGRDNVFVKKKMPRVPPKKKHTMSIQEDEKNAAYALIALYHQYSNDDYEALSVTVEGYKNGKLIGTIDWAPTWERTQVVPRNFPGHILMRNKDGDGMLVQWPPDQSVVLSEFAHRYPNAFHGMDLPPLWQPRGQQTLQEEKTYYRDRHSPQ
jgi:hypothetical protein